MQDSWCAVRIGFKFLLYFSSPLSLTLPPEGSPLYLPTSPSLPHTPFRSLSSLSIPFPLSLSSALCLPLLQPRSHLFCPFLTGVNFRNVVPMDMTVVHLTSSLTLKVCVVLYRLQTEGSAAGKLKCEQASRMQEAEAQSSPAHLLSAFWCYQTGSEED
jgi:hypothetical protein